MYEKYLIKILIMKKKIHWDLHDFGEIYMCGRIKFKFVIRIINGLFLFHQ